jgi:nucleotide-binding universal stress UspA family protein
LELGRPLVILMVNEESFKYQIRLFPTYVVEKLLKILVPHDGSPVSDKALRKAILFAKKLNYEIILLHIIDLKLLQSDSILKYINEKAALGKAKTQILRYLKAGSESMLKNRIETAKKQRVNIRFTLGIGSTAEGIVSVAEGREQNMVRVLGSVARNVSELADCPVMIVK